VVVCLGDIFYKVKEVDEQGWCTGVKDGRTGLYPENYAAVYWPHWSVMSFDNHVEIMLNARNLLQGGTK